MDAMKPLQTLETIFNVKCVIRFKNLGGNFNVHKKQEVYF